jgi:iron complex transport system substrate-binding protein
VVRVVLALALALCACGKRSAVSGDGTPRVVTLMPSGTEIVAALGATDELVGVDDYSKFPASVQALPKVGSFMFPNLETIIALRPTLVIVDDIQGKTAGALADAGIATVPCTMHALPDVKDGLRTIGARLGKATEAERVVAQIDAALDAAAARRPARRPRVLAVIDREADGLGNLVAVGPGAWVDELLAVVGGDNVLAPSGVRYPKLSLEEVLRAQPEVILDLSFAAQKSTAAWGELDVPAVKQGRVVALFEPYLTAPSPRVAAALDTLAKAIAPK